MTDALKDGIRAECKADVGFGLSVVAAVCADLDAAGNSAVVNFANANAPSLAPLAQAVQDAVVALKNAIHPNT